MGDARVILSISSVQSNRLQVETGAQIHGRHDVLKRRHDTTGIVDRVWGGRGSSDAVDLAVLNVLLGRRRSQLSTRSAGVAEAARCDELEWC